MRHADPQVLTISHIFPAKNGNWWWRARWNRSVWKPAREEAWGGAKWRFHDLRHHYCRWLLDAGMEAKDVSEMAGHSSVRVTLDVYVGSTEGRMARAAKILG